MPRIALIGAGSVIFCKTLMMDIMATEGLEAGTFVLMNPTEPKLRRMEAFAKDVIAENKLLISAFLCPGTYLGSRLQGLGSAETIKGDQ